MAKISHKNLLKNKSVYARILRDMGGVDFTKITSGEHLTGRFAYSENMYVDYESGSGRVIESIPGYRRILSVNKRINGIHIQSVPGEGEYVIVHAGEFMFRFPVSDRDRAEEYVQSGTLTFRDSRSESASVGGTLYVADGEGITRITPSGRVARVSDMTSAAPYIPVTYEDGAECEQKNLLTPKFIERFNVGVWNTYSYGTPGLIFAVTDEDEGLCAVTGCENGEATELFIPAYANIGGKRYKVDKVGSSAFAGNSAITTVRFADGVTSVSTGAFSGCASLVGAYLSPSMERIGFRAFADCVSLTEVHLGDSLVSVGDESFFNTSLSQVYFGGTEEELDATGIYLPTAPTVSCDSPYSEGFLEFPVSTKAAEIDGLFMNGKEQTVVTRVTNAEGEITSLRIYLKAAATANGAVFEIRGTAPTDHPTVDSRGADFCATDYFKERGGADAIQKCTLILAYGGKLFLSGNPDLPGTVFYSAKDKNGADIPLYFGSLNYFTDGNAAVRGLCTLHDSLAVLTGSEIYTHSREYAEKTRDLRFPIDSIAGGITVYGKPVKLDTDTVFLGEEGLCRISNATAFGERRCECTSSSVNPRLLAERLGEADLCVWRGYLVICAEGRMYLADKRKTFTHSVGGKDYEWYFLSGLGNRIGATRVYRYSESTSQKELSLHPSPGEVAQGTVYSGYCEDGSQYYYSKEEGVSYAVHPTEQMSGGAYSPAVRAASVGELLFFGTDDGTLFVFNNDMRGVPPPEIKNAEDFDPDAYAAVMKDRIHPYYYSFDGHAPRYVLSTFPDDCDVPYLLKSTVRNSLIVGFKSLGGGAVTVEVTTDTGGKRTLVALPTSAVSFDGLDFSDMSYLADGYFTVSIPERERRWLTKEITLSSDGYASPFGVYEISYRFTPSGNLK